MDNPPTSPIGVGVPGQFANPTGATLRPEYVERRPQMWAVGETDMVGLSIASSVATAAYAIGSFFLGVAANIIVSYAGADKLTETGKFLLYRGTGITAVLALFFFGCGIYYTVRKGNLWEKIKSESRQITPQ